MLLEFTIKNYKSFREQTTLSMVASNDTEKQDSNVFPITYKHSAKKQQNRLLKSAIIYGANASGKSNLLDAFGFMKWFVKNSSNYSIIEESIPTTPFLFNMNSSKKPSLFEIIFFCKNTRFRYGFEVDNKKVNTEWLFYAPKGKESKLFTREKNKIELGDSFKKEGKIFVDKTRENTLFLSVCAQFNGEISMNVLNCFSNINLISGIDDKGYFEFTANHLKDKQNKETILKFLKHADLGINDVHFEKKQIDKIPQSLFESFLEKVTIVDKSKLKLSKIETLELTSKHHVFDNKMKIINDVLLDFDDESQGTQKYFSLIGPILDTLLNGKVLFIDEFEARLHPKLTSFIVSLFHSKDINNKNAQLIITSHDVTLLTNKHFRRDQIWFCEKSKYGESELFSLMDFKDKSKVRKDASYNKNYLLGKYGAIPIIGDPKEIFENINE